MRARFKIGKSFGGKDPQPIKLSRRRHPPPVTLAVILCVRQETRGGSDVLFQNNLRFARSAIGGAGLSRAKFRSDCVTSLRSIDINPRLRS
jgi:hypothetical protein